MPLTLLELLQLTIQGYSSHVQQMQKVVCLQLPSSLIKQGHVPGSQVSTMSKVKKKATYSFLR